MGRFLEIFTVPDGEFIQRSWVTGAVDGDGHLLARGDKGCIILQTQGVLQILCGRGQNDLLLSGSRRGVDAAAVHGLLTVQRAGADLEVQDMVPFVQG